jgi:hypothetical protein
VNTVVSFRVFVKRKDFFLTGKENISISRRAMSTELGG